MSVQLTIDGREVDMRRVAAERRLTDRQRTALRMMRDGGAIRTYAAGRIVHADRGWCTHGERYPARPTGLECCRYGCADGFALMRALEKAGIVRHQHRGLWTLA